MASCLRDMPKQEEMLKSYKIHIELLDKVIKNIAQIKI
jgi:hypothetical protein